MRATWVALPLAVAMAGALGACDGLQFHLDCTEEQGICDAPDGGGFDGEAGADANVVVPPGCDLTKSPKDSPECVSDSVGVFVSPTGKDGATGTKADPLKAIAEAVTKGKPRVYVCEGSYDGPVTIAQPIAIFGGLTCAWGPSTTKPKLAPPKGIAIKIAKVLGAVLIEDLDIVANADANVPGDSAIAVFISESTNVSFKTVSVTAGPGTAGVKGASRSNYAGATATVGGSANGGTAGTGASCACTDASTSKGGNGAAGNGVGLSDGTSMPSVGVSNGGTSGTTTCTDGQPGANGIPSAGGAAATSLGTLSASGWAATAKPADAPNGKPAQGGGGGGAKTNVNSAGGGGACGGCGGAGGSPGTNGGSSFAVLSFNSTVTIEGGLLVSGAGGPGGTGGDGQAGQAGGALGAGAACNGGAGGNGAGGSGGGGGAGGHSVPIGFVGTEPKVTGATITPGAKGGIGQGGTPGTGPGTPGAGGTPGAEGKSQNTLSL